jgi:hypothetical protein
MTFVLTVFCATPYRPSSSLTRFQVFGSMARKHLSRKVKSITGLFRIREKSWRKGSLPMRMTASRKGRPSVCCTTRARRMFSEV